jgi:hypothetical protein
MASFFPKKSQMRYFLQLPRSWGHDKGTGKVIDPRVFFVDKFSEKFYLSGKFRMENDRPPPPQWQMNRFTQRSEGSGRRIEKGGKLKMAEDLLLKRRSEE